MCGSNKGFILYDGIVSLLLLATTAIFFNQIFSVNAKLNMKYTTQSEINNALYYKIDHPDANNFNDINFVLEGDKICGVKNEEKKCINK